MTHASDVRTSARPGSGPGGTQRPANIGTGGLERGLRQAVQGEVRFDAAPKAMSANARSSFRQDLSACSAR